MTGAFGGCHEDEQKDHTCDFAYKAWHAVGPQYLLIPTLPSPPESLSILSPRLGLLAPNHVSAHMPGDTPKEGNG